MARLRGLHPSKQIALAFTAIILLGTAALMTPWASADGTQTKITDALFTATSAVTVTGLGTLDTETHWSSTGHFILAVLIQLGGFGIIGFSTLVGFLLEGRISLKNRLMSASESSITASVDVKSLLKNIAVVMLTAQLLLFVFLFVRFATFYEYDLAKSFGHGVFHAISAFNNAGFALYSDSMIGFARDGWIIVPVFVTVIIASIGFPVIVEIRDRCKEAIRERLGRPKLPSLPAQWSLNTRIVLWATLVLLVLGALVIAIIEWNNPKTLGPLDPVSKVIDSIFASVMPRTAGFNAMDISGANPSSWLVMDVLMFIGGASASTAGGIKVGTAVVLAFIVYTEIRGETAVNIGNRRLPRSIQRQALTIVALTSTVVIGATLLMRFTTDFTLDQILFEVTSAVGTTGLSTGITASLPDWAKVLFSFLMLFGRLGPIVVATSLAMRRTKRHFEYPKEQPLIG